MVLHTREGKERVVAWSRMVADGPGEALKSDSAEAEWIVCIGTDLTDRLDAADVPPDGGAEAEDADATKRSVRTWECGDGRWRNHHADRDLAAGLARRNLPRSGSSGAADP